MRALPGTLATTPGKEKPSFTGLRKEDASLQLLVPFLKTTLGKPKNANKRKTVKPRARERPVPDDFI